MPFWVVRKIRFFINFIWFAKLQRLTFVKCTVSAFFLNISLLFATFWFFATFFETWENLIEEGDGSPENVFKVLLNTKTSPLSNVQSTSIFSKFPYFSLLFHFSLLFLKLGENLIGGKVVQKMYLGCPNTKSSLLSNIQSTRIFSKFPYFSLLFHFSLLFLKLILGKI